MQTDHEFTIYVALLHYREKQRSILADPAAREINKALARHDLANAEAAMATNCYDRPVEQAA